jgi:hypothetical protein
MIRFRCEQCDSLLETDSPPGAVESCVDCGLQILVPEPRAPRILPWKEYWRQGRKEQDDAARAQERVQAPPVPPHVVRLVPCPAREEAYRKLHARSLSIRVMGWVFAALALALLCPCCRSDVPCSQFFAMLSVCGMLLVGGLLLVAAGHLLAGIRMAVMTANGEGEKLTPRALAAASGE